MALKHPIKTTTNTTAQEEQFAQLHLPAPQTFDILPPLHELLARVDAYHNQGVSRAEAVVLDTGGREGGDSSAGDIGAAYVELQPLDPRELPTATLDIKARIRRALRELQTLPDMDRSVEEQEAELAELQLRIRRQREMLRQLGTTAEGLKGRLG